MTLSIPGNAPFLTADNNSFAGMSYSPAVGRNIKRSGYSTPTEIQSLAIPEISSGRDLIGLAQTGTGKTAAFVLPIIERLLSLKSRDLAALVISPTRELAQQTSRVFEAFARGTGLTITSLIGGTAWAQDRRDLRSRPPQILVGTPGKLAHCVNERVLSFSRIKVLVLDEADLLISPGSFTHDVNKILKASNPAIRQTLLFSATMPPAAAALAERVMRDPLTITVNAERPPPSIRHLAYHVEDVRQGDRLLLQVLSGADVERGIIFVRSKGTVVRISESLSKLGYSSTCISSLLLQGQRSKNMDDFKAGKYTFLVATDVAGRGIDIPELSHVYNFQFPVMPEDYVHRAGRTGRMGREGTVVTFLNPFDLRSGKLDNIAQRYNFSVEVMPLPELNSSSFAHRPLIADPYAAVEQEPKAANRQHLPTSINARPLFDRARRQSGRWNKGSKYEK